MSDHEDETINEENAPPKVVPQITTVTNISTKFPYLNKGDAKSMATNNDGNIKIRPPVTAEEHKQVQREEKARTILLSAFPDEHMGDFYHMIDARDIWNAIKARFDGNAESKKMKKSLLKQKFEEFKVSEEEGLDKGNDKMQKILTQMNTLKIKPDPEDVNMKFLRGLPPSWFVKVISLTKNQEIVAILPLTLSLLVLHLPKGSSKSKCSVVDDVIYSFFANHKIDQHFVYEDLDQMNKEDFKEYDLKHQMAMLSIKVHRFEKKHGRKIKFNGRKNASIDWDKQTEEGNTEPRSLENSGMVAGLEIASDVDSEGEVVSTDDAIPAGDVAATVVSPHSETEFALMGLSTEDLMTKLDNELANQAKWNNSGELGIDDSKFSIFHTNSDELEGQPIYNRKKATNSSEIKTNDDRISHSHDSVLFDFSDRSLKPSTNDFQTCNSSQEFSRPNHSDHDSNDSISSVSAPASESRDTIVIDCARQKDFLSVCTSSIETNVKSSKTLWEGKLGRRPTGKPVNPNRPNPVFAGRLKPVSVGRPNPVSAGQPNTVSAGDGILSPRPLNIQPKSSYFHSFTHNNQQIIFLITHNSLYSLYLTGGLNGKTATKPSKGWP
nr:ribonuclease H-like domain-containing protein [Tanacetum cinerariifolium]